MSIGIALRARQFLSDTIDTRETMVFYSAMLVRLIF